MIRMVMKDGRAMLAPTDDFDPREWETFKRERGALGLTPLVIEVLGQQRSLHVTHGRSAIYCVEDTATGELITPKLSDEECGRILDAVQAIHSKPQQYR